MSHRGRQSLGHVPFAANTAGYDPYQVDFMDPRRLPATQHPLQFQNNSPRVRRMSLQASQHVAQRPSPGRTAAAGVPLPSSGGAGDTEVTNTQLLQMIRDLQDDLIEVRGENMALKQTLNIQAHHISELSQKCDEMDQYGRRENVCFTNLKVTEERPCTQQVVELCHELGVEVTTSDLVDAHPLPSKRGKGNRCIARFRDRKKAQEVFAARKRTKEITPAKKADLAEQPNRGFAIQPNLTRKRAQLLGQLKDACQRCSWEACWADYKTGNLYLKMVPNTRPVPITNTHDILKYSGSNFTTQDFILCANEPFEVFNISHNITVED